MKTLRTEAHEQAAVIRWFNLQHPHLAGRLVASANGAYLHGNARSRSIRASHMIAQGMAPGFPDLFLPVPCGEKHGLFIEMKREKGGVVSSKQMDWIMWLSDKGYESNICCGFDEAKDVLTMYLMDVK